MYIPLDMLIAICAKWAKKETKVIYLSKLNEGGLSVYGLYKSLNRWNEVGDITILHSS